MIDLIEVFDRADQGPLISDTDYYMGRFVPKLAEVIGRHRITWDKNTIVNTDDDLADRVFQAAIDLIAEAGAYCSDSSRVMEFSRDEVLRAVEQAPKCARFGEGREAKTMYGRSVDDPSRPWIHIGGGIYTTDEQIYLDTVEGMAAIGIVDSLSVPSILHLRGKDARVRSPQELLSAIKTVILAREGIRRSGRAGLPIINGISAASNAVSMIAAAAPQFGLRTSDGFLVDFLSEMIVNYEALQKVAYFSSISANIGSTSTPLFGGYAGGAEGVAVLATAYLIMGNLIYRGSYHYNAPLHQSLHLSSTKPLLWAIGISNQANARNMRYPTVNLPYLGGGAGSRMFHYEMAAYMLAVVPAGGNIFSGHPAKSVEPDSLLPWDHQFHAEIGLAAAKYSRREAEPLAQQFYRKYEGMIRNPEPGFRYAQVYDLKTKKIVNADYLRVQDAVRAEFNGLGFEVFPS
ncbi:MAG: monomethylamine:corrinoid methyltransferase [Deltaproteobacteria bacterium]|nr:monomethylamine:corrinoid methyltransferase [Deltaproteobacteria bacterium]